MATKERITYTKAPVTVSPESSITVKLEESKGCLEQGVRIISAIFLPLILLIITVVTNCVMTEHTKKVEEAKQLNNYLDKLNEILIGEENGEENGKQTELIDYRPSFAFRLEQIKEIDYLTRAYTRNLNEKSKKIVLIYLYESDLINHSKAGNGWIGLEGICKNINETINQDVEKNRKTLQELKEKKQKGIDLSVQEMNTATEINKQFSEYPYCNLSTNRYYFDGIDMSDVFMQNIKLHNSYLNGANFSGAKLMGAEFMGSEFRGANFTKAVLKGANFSRSDKDKTFLEEANFTGADLTNANLTEANLQGIVLRDANLHKANLIGAENIDINQITKAYNWWTARYDPQIEKQLPLSEEQKEWRKNNIN